MRSTGLAILFCNVMGLCGCAQNDLFHPASISSGIAASHLIKKVMPAYPPIAKQEHVSGAVVLAVVIDEEGNVTDITPVSGPDLMRPAFIEAVKQWKYKTFEQNGFPVAMHTTITMNICFGG